MHILVTCKNEVDQIKNEGARVLTRFLPLKFYRDFPRRSRAANSAVLGLIWPNFELVRDAIDVLITCKYEEDPIKNEGARVLTTLYINKRHTLHYSGPTLFLWGWTGVFSIPVPRPLLPRSPPPLTCSPPALPSLPAPSCYGAVVGF